MNDVFFKRDIVGGYSSCYITNKHESQFDLLFACIASTDWRDIFYKACLNARLIIVKLIISRAINAEARQHRLFYLGRGLEEACKGRHIEIVKLLVKCGAGNLNNGLSIACKYSQDDIIDYLYEQGAKCCRYCFMGSTTRMLMKAFNRY